MRAATAMIATLIATAPSQAFFVTGNPASDGWTLSGHSLQNGDYVRGAANFAFEIYNVEFRVPTGANPLTTMTNPWNPGDRVVGLGGIFTQPLTPEQLAYPPGTVFTGPTQNSLIAGNTRVIAKFGVDFGGPGGNNYSPSTLAPAAGNGAGSHSAGNGGDGSVQVSIASNRFTPANANQLITPSITGAIDNVAQFGVPPGPGVGVNGLDLITGTEFLGARYIYTTDNNGFLSTWEVYLNTTMVGDFPGALSTVPTGGGNWILAVQAGSGAAPFTDGLVQTEPFVEAPAPPAIYLAVAGFAGLTALRRRRGRK